MKYLKYTHDRIFEFVETYEWEFITDEEFIVKYSFIDINKNEYLVEFKNDFNKVGATKILSKQYELAYYVKDEDNYSVSKIVNANPYRTLETIFGKILPDFLERKSWVNTIRMEGLSKDLEKDYISQRTKFYLRYLQRNPIPGFKLESHGNTIFLKK